MNTTEIIEAIEKELISMKENQLSKFKKQHNLARKSSAVIKKLVTEFKKASVTEDKK